jgi:transposase
MNYRHVIGIDMSKNDFHLAVMDTSTGHQIADGCFTNKTKPIKAFIKKHCRRGSVHVVMEATGNYHLLLTTTLAAHNIDYSVVNPLIIKRFGEMKMVRARTDKNAANLIAQYGHEQKPALSKPADPTQHKIKTLTTTIEQLTKQRTQLKNLKHAQTLDPAGEKMAAGAVNNMIRQLDKELNNLEKERQRLIKVAYQEIDQRLQSICGIGPQTSAAIISYMGDLSTFDNAKQAVAFAGINPKPHQSGTSINKTCGISKRGHKTLRTKLYMAALSASKHNNACRELYQRLLKNGKQKKTALIAVASKLLKQVFAIVKNETTFDNDYYLKYKKNA